MMYVAAPNPAANTSGNTGVASELASLSMSNKMDGDCYYGDAPETDAQKEVDKLKRTLDQTDEGNMLLMQCIALLIADNRVNAERFRSQGGSRVLYGMVPIAEARKHALRVIQQLVLDTSRQSHDDFSTLLELMQAAQPDNYSVKIDILDACQQLFALDARTQTRFREIQGFVYVISSLVSLSSGDADGDADGHADGHANGHADDADTNGGATPASEGSQGHAPITAWPHVAASEGPQGHAPITSQGSTLSSDVDEKMQLVQKIFETLTAAMVDSPANKQAMANEIRYDMLADSLQLSGLVRHEGTATRVFEYGLLTF